MPHVTEEIWAQFHDTRLIVSPWLEADHGTPPMSSALARAQTAARIYRRSGVRIKAERRRARASSRRSSARPNGR